MGRIDGHQREEKLLENGPREGAAGFGERQAREDPRAAP